LNRWANKIESENREGNVTAFNHPFLQSGFMFVGEFMCLIAFFISLHWTVCTCFALI
jgi:hypothetical protein